MFDCKAQIRFPWIDHNTYGMNAMNNLHVIGKNQLVFSCYKTEWILGSNGLPYEPVHPVLFRTSPDGGILITSKEFIKLGDTYIQFLSNVFE